MPLHDKRKQRLESLLLDYPSSGAFARLTGIDVHQVNSILAGQISMGPVIARQIEDALQLRHRWLDGVDDPNEIITESLDLHRKVREVEQVLCEMRDDLTRQQVRVNDLLSVVREMLRGNEPTDTPDA